jgi:pSer/pThr/pTyr-binding forkhead associated (FHA) protein
MSYQLVVVVGRSASQMIKLAAGSTVVGRNAECQLRIGSTQVSRRHCELTLENGRLSVQDLGSSNGTFVNGKKLEAPAVLKPGDEIEVGNVRFRVDALEDTALIPGTPRQPAKPSDTAVSDAISLDETDMGAGDDSTQMLRGATNAAEEAKVGIGEDEVADLLLNIELDDEDKL